MNPVVTTLVTSTANELTKLATSVIQYKQATYAIEAELVQAEMVHQREMAQIKSNNKRAKQQIAEQANAFSTQSQSIEKDKKALRKLHRQAIQRAMNAQSLDEYQRQINIAKHLEEELKEIRSQQQDNYVLFSHHLTKTTQTNHHRHINETIIDAEYSEI